MTGLTQDKATACGQKCKFPLAEQASNRASQNKVHQNVFGLRANFEQSWLFCSRKRRKKKSGDGGNAARIILQTETSNLNTGQGVRGTSDATKNMPAL